MSITYIGEYGDEVYVRKVPAASEVVGDGKYSVLVEEAVRNSASTLGLPDFVFRPRVASKGAAVRELSDGLLLVDGVALILQTKARAPQAVADPDRERNWLTKHAAAARRQVDGTARTIASADHTEFVNARGRRLPMRTADLTFLGVVVLDHPNPPSGVRLVSTGRVPVVHLLRRDWEFLHRQLGSGFHVVRYLQRIQPLAVEDLGYEPVRYYELAMADEAAPPDTRPSGVVLRAGVRHSMPLLPLHEPDARELSDRRLLRELMEDIAIQQVPAEQEHLLQEALEALDSLPVNVRPLVTQKLRSCAGDVVEGWQGFVYRNIDGRGPQLLFGVCPRYDERARLQQYALTQLRHAEWAGVCAPGQEPKTACVMLTPNVGRALGADTTLLFAAGPSALTRNEVRTLQRTFNPSVPRPAPKGRKGRKVRNRRRQ